MIKIELDMEDLDYLYRGKYTDKSCKEPETLVRRLHHNVIRLDSLRKYWQNCIIPDCLVAVTVTVGGRKDYGKLNYIDQYHYLKKWIKKRMGYHKPYRYMFTYEINSSGVGHLHGLVDNSYSRKEFMDTFKDLGSRNCHKDSYQTDIRDLPAYLDYIFKDYGEMARDNLYPIHNIQKKDITLEKEIQKEDIQKKLQLLKATSELETW